MHDVVNNREFRCVNDAQIAEQQSLVHDTFHDFFFSQNLSSNPTVFLVLFE